ncbi:hypothetical protein VCRA2133E348_250067 [Vibrio crassostreae]|nr:hypothetical protein VCRA2119O48_220067 [Vibrio crassostreae]CAK2810765.1 hypothetical protein VCRA2133E348_250067 [Vibrio crassostreae]CAK3286162.1 hypothetical protein VCRA213O314_240028 [Vibrio crassostreae]CAK3850417.1 hypothetical protein VCRA212O16_230068 [Vibrio crassostreae]
MILIIHDLFSPMFESAVNVVLVLGSQTTVQISVYLTTSQSQNHPLVIKFSVVRNNIYSSIFIG